MLIFFFSKFSFAINKRIILKKNMEVGYRLKSQEVDKIQILNIN